MSGYMAQILRAEGERVTSGVKVIMIEGVLMSEGRHS